MRGRRSVRVVVVGALLLTAGCSGGSGNQATSTSTAPTPSTSSTTSHPRPTTHPASPTPTPDPTVVPVPKVTPTKAQPAVDAYIGFLDAEIQVGQNPGVIGRALMNRFLGPKATAAVGAQLGVMSNAGTAFRGIPDTPRLRVVKFISPQLIRLTNCPLPATHNPYRVFNLTTGKDVVVPKRNPPPPYLLTLTMFKTKTRWILNKFTQDTSKTCTG